jgi:hypothetical protein
VRLQGLKQAVDCRASQAEPLGDWIEERLGGLESFGIAEFLSVV